ncbi:MAG: protease modulator HflC [Phycisphaerae bacterium]
MRNLPTLLAAGLVVLILGFYMCTFQVRFTEVAIKKTFGNPTGDTIQEPGLKLKWPWPIQSVVKFDKRIRVLEDRTEETITADSKNLIVTTSTLWTIVDPYLFHNRFDRDEDGEKQLRSAIRSQKKAIIGQYNFSNFVSTNASDRKLREIERRMLEPVREVWRKEYGVDVTYFGITKLTLPQSVTKAIFDSMKKNEENKAANYKAEGVAQSAEIIADARAKRERIMAVANRKADQIRNEGQRIVSGIYAQFQENPELRIFLDKLKALEEAFQADTTLIMDTTFAPVDLFEAERGERTAGPDLDAVQATTTLSKNVNPK